MPETAIPQLTGHLTRREFLKWCAAGTSVASLLAACSAQPSPAVPTLRPDLARAQDLAGDLAAITPTTLTLRNADQVRPMALSANVQVYAPSQVQIGRDSLSPGSTVGVWLDERQQVTSIQLLPPMTGPHTVPVDIPQPQPTGELKSFGPLPMITRAGWGAAPANVNAPAEHGLFDAVTNPEGWLVYLEPLSQAFNTVVVHHSALALDDGPRVIQELHMSVKGYADMGYHYVVDSLGVLYEGRVLKARGAHTGGHNTGTVGVVLLGNFNVIQPCAAQLGTLRRLSAYLKAAYHITHLAGHRDFQPDETECPGQYLEQQLPALAATLDLKFGTEGYVPPAWSKATPP